MALNAAGAAARSAQFVTFFDQHGRELNRRDARRSIWSFRDLRECAYKALQIPKDQEELDIIDKDTGAIHITADYWNDGPDFLDKFWGGEAELRLIVRVRPLSRLVDDHVQILQDDIAAESMRARGAEAHAIQTLENGPQPNDVGGRVSPPTEVQLLEIEQQLSDDTDIQSLPPLKELLSTPAKQSENNQRRSTTTPTIEGRRKAANNSKDSAIMTPPHSAVDAENTTKTSLNMPRNIDLSADETHTSENEIPASRTPHGTKSSSLIAVNRKEQKTGKSNKRKHSAPSDALPMPDIIVGRLQRSRFNPNEKGVNRVLYGIDKNNKGSFYFDYRDTDGHQLDESCKVPKNKRKVKPKDIEFIEEYRTCNSLSDNEPDSHVEDRLREILGFPKNPPGQKVKQLKMALAQGLDVSSDASVVKPPKNDDRASITDMRAWNDAIDAPKPCTICDGVGDCIIFDPEKRPNEKRCHYCIENRMNCSLDKGKAKA